jgi:hypothetical protein
MFGEAARRPVTPLPVETLLVKMASGVAAPIFPVLISIGETNRASPDTSVNP